MGSRLGHWNQSPPSITPHEGLHRWHAQERIVGELHSGDAHLVNVDAAQERKRQLAVGVDSVELLQPDESGVGERVQGCSGVLPDAAEQPQEASPGTADALQAGCRIQTQGVGCSAEALRAAELLWVHRVRRGFNAQCQWFAPAVQDSPALRQQEHSCKGLPLELLAVLLGLHDLQVYHAQPHKCKPQA